MPSVRQTKRFHPLDWNCKIAIVIADYLRAAIGLQTLLSFQQGNASWETESLPLFSPAFRGVNLGFSAFHRFSILSQFRKYCVILL
jgi:hypothetical protein